MIVIPVDIPGLTLPQTGVKGREAEGDDEEEEEEEGMEVEEEGSKEPAPTTVRRKRKASPPEAAADVRPSPSKRKAGKGVTSKDSPHSSPKTTPTKGAERDKPVCKYGVKCYQKNPQHRKMYSHPLVSERGRGKGRRRRGGEREEGVN